MSSMSLSELFSVSEEVKSQQSEQPAPEPEPEQAEAPEPEAQTPEQEPPKEAETEEAPAEDGSPTQVPLAALKEERHKRQDLERQLAELRGQTQVYERLNQKTPEKEDTENVSDKFYSDPVAFLESRLQEKEQQYLQRELHKSVLRVKDRHTDAVEVLQAFDEYASQNPAVWNAVYAHHEPAELAYEQGKIFMQTKEFGGSLESLREQVRKEEREKVIAELKKEGALKAASQVTKSNADARGTADARAPKFTGPSTTEDLYRKR